MGGELLRRNEVGWLKNVRGAIMTNGCGMELGRMVGKRLRRRGVGWLKNGREAINTNGGGMVT